MKKTVVCRCEHCGNEAEMVVTCSLAANGRRPAPKPVNVPQPVKGTAVCSHCGNEAEMWVDL